MAKDTAHDNESETVKVLLDLLRRVDKEVQVTVELSPQALKAIERYKKISQQLAVGGLQQHIDRFSVREPWAPRGVNSQK